MIEVPMARAAPARAGKVICFRCRRVVKDRCRCRPDADAAAELSAAMMALWLVAAALAGMFLGIALALWR